jgi:hypothetical protein
MEKFWVGVQEWERHASRLQTAQGERRGSSLSARTFCSISTTDPRTYCGVMKLKTRHV